MFKPLQLKSALLCGLVLCLASSSSGQTPDADKPKANRQMIESKLRFIESKLEEVLDLLPATLSGKELETARKQIDTAFKTIVDGAKKAAPDANFKRASRPNAGGVGGPNASGPNAGGPGGFFDPYASGPNAGGPNAGGPNAGGPNAGGPGAGNPFGGGPSGGPGAGSWNGSGERSKQASQPQVGRYQISSWTLPPPSGQGTGDVGAFVIDTQTGTIWKVIDGHSPTKLGQVKE